MSDETNSTLPPSGRQILDEMFASTLEIRERRHDVRMQLECWAREVREWGQLRAAKRFSARVRPGRVEMDRVPYDGPIEFTILIGNEHWLSCQFGPGSTFPVLVTVLPYGTHTGSACTCSDIEKLDELWPTLLREPASQARFAQYMQLPPKPGAQAPPTVVSQLKKRRNKKGRT